LAATLGIEQVTANPATGSVLVVYDRRCLTRAKVLHILERSLDELSQRQSYGYVHPEGGQAQDVGCLALAATADFAITALAPLSAGLLVVTNLKTVRDAATELTRLRPGMATLYSAIIAATLASGLYFSAALMAWLMQMWDRQYHRRFTAAQRQLLASCRKQSPFVWLWRGDTEIEVPLEQVHHGDVLVLRAGETVPADGIVVWGSGQLEDEWRAAAPSCAKKAGDRIWAGSQLISGALRMRVIRTGNDTLAASVHAIIERVTTPSPKLLKVRGEPFASSTVAPTLATAAIGLLTGDIHTANAILRADYASGPGMTLPLGLLQDIADALQNGVVVSNSELFKKLRAASILLIDGDHLVADSGTFRIDRPRSSMGLSIGLVTRSEKSESVLRAGEMGADFVCRCPSPKHLAELVRHYEQRGQRVAFVGDCWRNKAPARLAHVSISSALPTPMTSGEIDAYLLNREISKLSVLWEIAHRQPLRSWRQAACTVLPNLLCVAGAFTLGFTGLHTVLLTNVGTFTAYRSSERWLRDESPFVRKTVPVARRLQSGMVGAARLVWNEAS
jgi:cation transport ATPase